MTATGNNTLLIDAGNSRFKWALAAGGQLTETGVATYQQASLLQQLADCWASLAANDKRPQRILMCNVKGEDFAQAVRQWVDGLRASGPAVTLETVLAQASACGVSNAYREPERLGADRWAALVAAKHHLRGAACIIDCGTALTIDVISAQGGHQGGIIVPGMKLMQQCLIDNTHGIRARDGETNAYLGRDTSGALQAGALAAACGAVMQTLQQARQELGVQPQVIVTGGDAPQLLAGLPAGFRHEPHWVLKGLAVIAGERQ